MKRVISLVLILCMIFSFAACGDDRVEETKNIDATESTTTTTRAAATTTRPSQKVITVDEVKDHIESYFRSLGSSGSSAGIVDKGTEKKDGKDVCSFAFNNNNVGVVVHTVGGNVEQIISVAAVSAFKIGDFSAAEAAALATTFALLPSSICYKEKDVRSLIMKIMESKKELLDDGSIAYSYKEEECFYTLIISETLITAAVKREIEPIETTQTTTTTAQEDSVESTEVDVDDDDENSFVTSTNKTDSGSAVYEDGDDVSVTTKGKTGVTTTKAVTPKTTTKTTEADPCTTGHDWEEITESVQHEEVGHYEEVVTDYNTITKYKCAVCYAQYDSLNSYYTHFEGHLTSSGSSVAIFRDRYTTSQERQPIYENQWIVDEEAYTEERVVGHKCRVCGKTE